MNPNIANLINPDRTQPLRPVGLHQVRSRSPDYPLGLTPGREDDFTRECFLL